MTDDKMNLRALMEKSSDVDLLREMIGYGAERLMELEVRSATGAGFGEKNPLRLAQRTAIATGIGRRGPAPSSCASPSSGRAPTSRASWSRGGWPKRRSRR